MTCNVCGNETHVDFRNHRQLCDGCQRAPLYCSCAPVQAKPRWLQLAKERKYGLARALDQAAA